MKITNDKKIIDFVNREDIKITRTGKIYKRNKLGNFRLMSQACSCHGYLSIDRNLLVHRIVFYRFKNFLNSNQIINHKDGNPQNNNIKNLESISLSDNSRHARDILNKSGKINKDIANKIRKNKENLTPKEWAKKYNLNRNSIYRILDNTTWSDKVKTKKYDAKNKHLSSNQMIQLMINDSLYEFKKNGDIYTYYCAKGRTILKKKRKIAKIEDHGYHSVRYKQRTLKLHRVIFAKFKGTLVEGYVINHIDGNRKNNHLSNLEQITVKENNIHSSRILKRGIVVLTMDIVNKIRYEYANRISYSHVYYSKLLKVHVIHIRKIVSNVKWHDPNYNYIPRKHLLHQLK